MFVNGKNSGRFYVVCLNVENWKVFVFFCLGWWNGEVDWRVVVFIWIWWDLWLVDGGVILLDRCLVDWIDWFLWVGCDEGLD